MRALAAVLALAVCAAPALSQRIEDTLPTSPVVVLDRDALFMQSLFGRRIARDLETAAADLVAENLEIEARLEAEERALTAQRDGMEMADFRALAVEFDGRVTDIRQAQDAKGRAIAQQTDRAQQVFLDRANPVLVQLARDTGALVILDRRNVIASADQVDITNIALTRIDEVLGDGGSLLEEPPQQRPSSTAPDTD